MKFVQIWLKSILAFFVWVIIFYPISVWWKKWSIVPQFFLPAWNLICPKLKLCFLPCQLTLTIGVKWWQNANNKMWLMIMGCASTKINAITKRIYVTNTNTTKYWQFHVPQTHSLFLISTTQINPRINPATVSC